MRDKKGMRYVKMGRKKILVDPRMPDTEFIKWLLKFVTKKKKRTKTTREAKAPVQVPASAPSEGMSQSVLNYINNERVKAELPRLTGAPIPGLLEYADSKEVKPEEKPEPKAIEHKKERKRTKIKVGADEIDAELDPELVPKIEEVLSAAKKSDARKSMLETKAAQEAFEALSNQMTAADVRRTIADYADEMKWGAARKRELHTFKKPEGLRWLLDQGEEITTASYNALLEEARKKILVGDGSKKESKGALTNFDIDRIMAPYKPRYLGTIASDAWKQLTEPVKDGKSAFIVNTDPSGQPGTHWVAFLLDRDLSTIEYYDSFAEDIPSDMLIALKDWIDTKVQAPGYLKLKVNHVIDQDAKSENCGWFCCKFIIDRFRGKSWRECTRFDEHVKGEKDIARFKKYNTYL